VRIFWWGGGLRILWGCFVKKKKKKKKNEEGTYHATHVTTPRHNNTQLNTHRTPTKLVGGKAMSDAKIYRTYGKSARPPENHQQSRKKNSFFL
jgi:hypothetical protein